MPRKLAPETTARKFLPGVWRAAREIHFRETDCKQGPECESCQRMAEIIDRETAAPEMLEALEGIAETLDKMAPCPEEILDALLATAQSAIRKARGEQ